MAEVYSGELITEKEPINFGTVNIPVIKGDTGEGRNLEFIWQGTSLGVRLEGEEAYQFVDLKGEQGIQGEQGEQGVQGQTGKAFSVYKTYASIEEMNADIDNVEEGNFVLIATTVSEEDNAKLFVKGQNEFVFLTDLSGAQGIQGEKGEQGIQGEQGNEGKSAYEVAVKNGYGGSEDEWLSSLKGYSYNRVVDFYVTTSDDESMIEISGYDDGNLVDVFVNGFLRPASSYTVQNIDDKYYVVFDCALDEIGTEVEVHITEVLQSNIDTEVVENSVNPVTGGAVKNYVDDKVTDWELITEFVSEEDGEIIIDLGGEYKEIDAQIMIPSNEVSNGELLYYFNGHSQANKTRTTVSTGKDYYGIITGIVKWNKIEGSSQITNTTNVYDNSILRSRSDNVEASCISSIRLKLWSGKLPAGTQVVVHGRR